MIDQPRIIPGDLAVDDRGILRFINVFDLSQYQRFYLVENHHKGIVRAFHGHMKERKAAFVIKGAAKFVLSPLRKDENKNPLLSRMEDIRSFVLSGEKPSILHIPCECANGFVTLTDDTIIQFFSTSSLEESKGDDYRFPWDSYGEEIWEVENR